MHWMVLHRPAEPAALAGKVGISAKSFDSRTIAQQVSLGPFQVQNTNKLAQDGVAGIRKGN
jgi:hypothetical protein